MVLGHYASFVKQYCILYDRKTKARAAVGAGTAFTYPVEPFKYPYKMFLLYSGAGVVKFKIVRFFILTITINSYINILACIRNGIFRKVPEY